MEAMKHAHKNSTSAFARVQLQARKWHETDSIQLAIAVIILGNFALSIVGAQLNPEEGTKMYQDLEKIDIAFTAIFTVELLFNMLGTWFYDFWRDGWNCFDFVIVMITLVSFILTNLPGLSILRMMRVFRVIRVFRRLKSLRKVLRAVAASMLPVLNAFVVLAIVTCVYAVIAVQLYSDLPQSNGLFDNFGAAIFTMLQVCTSDGWATDVVRPMFGEEEGNPKGSIAIFFVSYMLIVGTVLLNVVIAVLLDEFITSVAKDKAEERKERKKNADDVSETIAVLDPLLITLMAFNTSRDLTDRIRAIYQVLDSDDSGGLSYSEMADGVRRLRTDPPIVLSIEDFDTITEGGALLDENGEITPENFERMIRRQLAVFVQRRAAQQMAETEDTDPTTATVNAPPLPTHMLFVLKQLTLGIEITGSDNTTIDLPAAPMSSPLTSRNSRGNSALKSDHSLHGRAGSGHHEHSSSGAHHDHAAGHAPHANSHGAASGASEAAMHTITERLVQLDSKVESILRHLSIGPSGHASEAGYSPHAGGVLERGGGRRDDERGRSLAARLPHVNGQPIVDADFTLETADPAGFAAHRRRQNRGKHGSDDMRAEQERDLTNFIAAASSQLHTHDKPFHEDRSGDRDPSGKRSRFRQGHGQSSGRGSSGSLNPLGHLSGRKKSVEAQKREDRNMHLEARLMEPHQASIAVQSTEVSRRSGAGERKSGRPMVLEATEPDMQMVRVSWASNAQWLYVDQGLKPCRGCERCCGGFVNVGCLLCGECMVLVSDTGTVTDGWTSAPDRIPGDHLAVHGQKLLRKYAKYGKVVDPTRYVDSPHADGRHMYRCYIVEDRWGL